MRTPVRTATHALAFENLSTTFLLIATGLLIQALIAIYINPACDEITGFDKEDSTMTDSSKLSTGRSRSTLKDEDEDPSTIQNKFMVGYQGWFTCQGDGRPIEPGHHGWLHWIDKPLKDGGRVTFEMWPDTTDYDEDELYELSGLSIASAQGSDRPTNRPAKVFSSRNPKTVNRHYRWMRDHGISGAFLQRFLGEVGNGDNGMRQYRDEVVQRVKESANSNGRVWAIMYDISGVPSSEIEAKIKTDYLHLLNDLRAFDDPMYLHEKGRPVVAIWGMGMAHEKHNVLSLIRLIEWIKNTTPQGAYIFAGSPSHWRTRDGDCDADPDFDRLWQKVDCMSPWYVGRFGTIEDAANFKQRMVEDTQYLQAQDEELGLHRDYSPVVFPGFSWQNLHNGPRNEIPREGGTFLYRQLQNAISIGAKTIYGAMFDEYDEGTVLMPVVSDSKDTPSEVPFLALDEDDMDLPSDWYLRICGLAARSLRTGTALPGTFPMQSLMAWNASPVALEEQLAGIDLTSGKQVHNQVNRDAIAGVLQSMQPPSSLASLDRLSSDYTSMIDRYKYETTRNLLALKGLLDGHPNQADLGTDLTLNLWLTLLRLNGPGELQSLEGIRLSSDCLNNMQRPADIAHRLLLDGIKPAFAANPHPQVDTNTGRKLAVAAGGERAKHEMFEDQRWKTPASWGISNVLYGCLVRMSAAEIADDIALILPPLLTLMDDYETFYRDQGLKCLDAVLDKIDARTLKRMGIDNLFLKSVQHSISLHPTPPNPPVLVHGLTTLFRLLSLIRDPTSEDYANEVALAVDQGIKDGWQYAPSGMDGIEMMVEIGMGVELVCKEIGLGIVRWLNDLIPGLLSSSYLPPSPYAVGLQLTNLHALHILLETISSTDRSERWRGQVLDALARNWVGVEEDLKLRSLTGGSTEDADYQATVSEMQTVQVLLRTVLEDLVQRRPDMRQNEIPALMELSPLFAGLCEGLVIAPAGTGTGPPPLPTRRLETAGALSRQPPPMPPRNQESRAEVAGPVQNGQPGPALPPRPESANAGESRFVPPLPTGGMLKTAPLPPRRTVEAVEVPEVEQDNSRIGQARQHVNQIYDQYSPTIDAKKRDAQRAAQNMGGFAGRLMAGTQQNKEGNTQGNVGLKDLERMGQKALWNLGKAGTRVAGGIDRLQQQGRAQNAKPT